MIWETLHKYKKNPVAPSYPSDLLSFYTLSDDVHSALKILLNSASHSIVLNMYGYDDDELNNIIVQKAADPNIYVQMSLDKTQSGGAKEKALLESVYNQPACNVITGQSAKHRISHLKMLIVDGLYTATGSTNWSLDGEQKQDNELTVVKNATYAASYRSVLDTIHLEMLRQNGR